MRAAGRVAREVLDIAGQAVRVGITTDEIDHLVHAETIKVRLSGAIHGSFILLC
jgi:methionyl aminopeptidase